MIPKKSCIVLVPYAHLIEPECEDGLRELQRRGYAVVRQAGSAIDQMRSAMATDAIAAGFSEIMWIDSDIGFHPEDVDKLRSHNKPIACGLYSMKGGGGVAARYLPQAPQFGSAAGLHEIDLAATGFLFTKREVYDSLGMPKCNLKGRTVTPYFLPMLAGFKGGLEYLGEDFAFCRRARERGFKIYADTTIKLRHIGRCGFEIDGGSSEISSYRQNSIWSESPKVGVVVVGGELSESFKSDVGASLLGWDHAIIQSKSINAGIRDAVSEGCEAILVADPCGQMFDRAKLITAAINRNTRIVIGDSTLFCPKPKEIVASHNNAWKCPIYASVIHSSAIPKSSEIVTELSPWVNLEKCGAYPEFVPGVTAYVARIEPSAQSAEEIQAQADLEFDVIASTRRERAWERIVDIDSSGMTKADTHFNPGLIEFGGKTLLAYRFDKIDNITAGLALWERHVDIGISICEMDGDFQPVPGSHVRLDLPTVGSLPQNKVEDPRLFEHAGKLFISYVNSFPKQGRSAMGMARLGKGFEVEESWFWNYGRNACKDNKPLRRGGPIPRACEKNWAHFSSGGQLYAVYDSSRQTVIQFDFHTKQASQAASNEKVNGWRFGEIRGGTPPVLIGDEYFTFFHSSFLTNRLIFNQSIYVAGFYAFQAEAPFKITRISKEPLMAGSIHDPCPQRPGVVFPSGAIYRDGRWAVSYGHNDFKCKIVEFDHQKLLKLCRRPFTI